MAIKLGSLSRLCFVPKRAPFKFPAVQSDGELVAIISDNDKPLDRLQTGALHGCTGYLQICIRSHTLSRIHPGLDSIGMEVDLS